MKAAAQRQSEACGMAALALLSGVSAAICASGRLASKQLASGVLHVAQLLVQVFKRDGYD